MEDRCQPRGTDGPSWTGICYRAAGPPCSRSWSPRPFFTQHGERTDDACAQTRSGAAGDRPTYRGVTRPGHAPFSLLARARHGHPRPMGCGTLYAASEHDLLVAQGYIAAMDRLFQLELWRRQATGTVAEVLGPRELKRDIGARLFKFRGDMSAEWITTIRTVVHCQRVRGWRERLYR